jgi:hypothetical protein
MHFWESPELSDRDREEFWRRVVEFETAPMTTLLTQLTRAGLELPEPAAMDDAELSRRLWSAIRALSRMRVFITQTDHLSDRALYTALYERLLREEMPATDGGTWHVDLLGGWSHDDTVLFLKHYADDAWRQDWIEHFPDFVMPEHEDPPFHRDHRLPKP